MCAFAVKRYSVQNKMEGTCSRAIKQKYRYTLIKNLTETNGFKHKS